MFLNYGALSILSGSNTVNTRLYNVYIKISLYDVYTTTIKICHKRVGPEKLLSSIWLAWLKLRSKIKWVEEKKYVRIVQNKKKKIIPKTVVDPIETL